ncbi:MAG: PIG-L family deacetylase, partial [Clostridia bacterium]|nr:PIG-L family deacetylase [Clostridia bacterium]
MIKKFLLPLAFCIMLTLAAFATEAADISGEVNITAENLQKSVMLDRKITTASSGEDVTITLESQVPMGGVWLRYSAAPIGAALDGKPISENGFFSEYIELGGKKSAVFTFEAVTICEFYVYSEGVLPSEVQLWEVGQNETDLMLFAAHSDDDQLFFAGLIPYYIARDDVDVKVCFLTTPYQDISRVQELLAGLWHCGLKTYPTILTLPDDWSESFDEAKRILERRGHSYDEISATVRDVLNTYKPQVLVLHDFKGEYGHGMHIFATNTIIDTIENAAEGDFVPNKIYVHLYKQNEIILPIDDPLDFFGGKSAFNVSQEAFRYHKSQHWTWFYGWIYGDNGETTKASQIRYCSPQKYGLYYSSEGADTGNDMLENIETYAAKREREEAERQAEESRLA